MPKRRPHTAHRFRVISRCPTCGSKLLSGCSYKSRRGGACIATRDDRPIVKGRHVHYCGRIGKLVAERIIVRGVRVVDMTHAARLIFGDIIAPGGEIGL